MEGYNPQDFSFFHRSEKLVQQINILTFSCSSGTQVFRAIRSSGTKIILYGNFKSSRKTEQDFTVGL